MSGATAKRIGALALETATEAAWAQWACLGASVVTERARHPRSVVDPEALVLASLAMAGAERRLEDVLEGWAHEGARLLSVQRLRSLADRFPPEVKGRIGDFARYAVAAGDRRWTRLARPPSSVSAGPRGKPFGAIRLTAGPALMLRLRAGFGVGSKGDVLAFLLADGGRPQSVKQIVSATAYTDRAVRTAVEEMARAGFVLQSTGRPATYRAERDPWVRLLGPAPAEKPSPAWSEDIPPWRSWASAYAFLVAVAEWAQQAQGAEWSAYVLGSRARSLLETHVGALTLAGLEAEVAGGRTRPADELVPLLERFREWVRESL